MDADKSLKHRCYAAHDFSQLLLNKDQIKGFEDSLWVALRMMEERKNLLKTMDDYGTSSKNEPAIEIEIHVERLKAMLLKISSSFENDDLVN